MSVAVRVVALVVAIGLVVAALVLRAGRDGAPGDGGSLLGGAGPTVSCPADIDLACDIPPSGALTATAVRDVATTVELATSGALEEDAAVVPAAWADVIDDQRERAGRRPLARVGLDVGTPLVTVAWADRATVLASVCGVGVEAITWGCIGDHADRTWQDLGGDVRWGRVQPGHLAPDTATGLQATLTVVAGRLGADFSLTELRDVGFTSWLRTVERAVPSHRPPGGSHLRAMVTRGPSVADVAVATEAEAIGLLARSTAFGELVAIAAQPVFDVELVVVGEDPDVLDEVRDVLRSDDADAVWRAEGWRIDGAAPAGAPLPGLVAQPAPDGGVLTAMRATWREIAG